MITVTTKLLALEGREAELADALGALAAASLAVGGCRRAEISRSVHDPRRFLLVAGFDDAAAHGASANDEACAAALKTTLECLEGLPEIEIYEG